MGKATERGRRSIFKNFWRKQENRNIGKVGEMVVGKLEWFVVLKKNWF